MPKAKSKIKNTVSISPHHYTYPSSVTLKNKYGTKNLASFLEKCSHDTTKALINLREEPLPEYFDSSYLKYIHKCLFENTFEWAGHTRDEVFTFADGTSAAMPEMKRTGWENPFAIGDEIREGLQKLDQTLFEKNNLQNLTREEFISEAMEMFNSLNHIHPFREGNGRTQRFFFENLAKAAGHSLDFSLVTKERMMLASIAVEKEGNLEPMKHLFEDISHPEKILLLKEFMDNMKESGRNVNDRPVMVAKEGETYTGLFRGMGVEGFAFNVKGAFIIGNKEHLTPEQLKTLKSGERFTFTVPRTQELEKILIPEETLAPLSKSELFEKVAEDACVHTCRQQIQHLSKTIYGSSKTLDKEMVKIIKNPELGQQLSNQINRSPSSVANLVGFDLFCLKTSARANAEEHVETLCCAIVNFAHAVRHAEKEITQEHQAEQNRRGQKVVMPSKDLKDLLTLPKELQQEALENNSSLQKELCTLLKNIKGRLSSTEHKAVRDGDHGTLAKSLGVSERKAQEITEITKQAREAHQQVQTRTASHSKALAMAS
ncbi:BID domain-containing T4SS effector [Bartonella vinsonii]|uniref:protein adenylyltransferase n=1 Tax=Bartonella vinsonii TaxID=33047 RepID=A0A3S5F8X1_BARVI|nr:BID domain-containing T4SS effector [Bartonella vinsonii]VEJ45895.1 Probable adenosine monophosphate-protein transferase fic [Bartonella vinsonii]